MILIPPAVIQTRQDSIRSELEGMYNSDQQGRSKLLEIQQKYGPFSPKAFEIIKELQISDKKNQQTLIAIVDQHGWPKMSDFGEKAALSAFLVLQHSGHSLQARYLPLVKRLALLGEFKTKWLAFLEDRVRIDEGKKQLYGTQLIEKKGPAGFQLQPIEDEVHVDERRAEMGLGPLADYLKQFGIVYRKPLKSASAPQSTRTPPQAAGPFLPGTSLLTSPLSTFFAAGPVSFFR